MKLAEEEEGTIPGVFFRLEGGEKAFAVLSGEGLAEWRRRIDTETIGEIRPSGVLAAYSRFAPYSHSARLLNRAERSSAVFALCANTWFHPSWGRGRAEAKRRATPGSMPRPSTPGDSSLPSKKSCMPRQIPRLGLRARHRSAKASSMPRARIAAAAAPKAPTPGRTARSAPTSSSASAVGSASAPARARAASTEARLATPVAATATFGRFMPCLPIRALRLARPTFARATRSPGPRRPRGRGLRG